MVVFVVSAQACMEFKGAGQSTPLLCLKQGVNRLHVVRTKVNIKLI